MRKHRITILFTPRTPRGQIATFAVAMYFVAQSAILQAQTTNLDSVQVYEASYRQYMLQKWTAERKEFTVVNKKKWWYWLPGVGLQFGLPSVNVNTGILAQIDRDRVVMSARLQSLDSRYQVEFVEQLAKIRVEHRKLLVRSEQLARERKLLDKLRGIQAIHNEAFNSQNMAPEQHLQVSYQYEKAVSDWRNRESELVLSVLDFFALCRFEMPDTKLVELVTNEGCQKREHQFPGITVSSVATRR